MPPTAVFFLLAGALALPASPARALTAAEVIIVANERAEGSVPLGKYYAVARGIDPDRLVIVQTTAAPDIARADYNAQVRDVLRDYLKKNDPDGKIKCIVLMWGVPVRVLGTPISDEQKALAKRWKTAQVRMAGRLAVNLKLLEIVTVQFPQPRTEGLTPPGLLFPPETIATPDRAETFDRLAGQFRELLKIRTAAAARLPDKGKQAIALRQLAALRLDTLGPEDLAANLPDPPVAGIPDADTIRKTLAIDRADLKLLVESAENSPPRKRGVQGDDAPTSAPAIGVTDIAEAARKVFGLIDAYAYAEKRAGAVETLEEDASVDSELSLIWDEGKNLRRWRPNPMNWRLAMMPRKPADTPEGLVMTARIDGPKPADALRIIKDSLAAERDGLTGKFYIDAGGKYPAYDANLRALAQIVQKGTKIPVKLDEKKELFGPGQCPDAALYVGWYGLQKYVPSFTWSRGAVAWHIASLEAVHLRVAASDEWCVKMIQNGVAATLGAVNEPYLGAFPLPQDFFALLLTGRFTVGECYWRTVPLTSWRMTLIADPLYNPYALRPQLSIYQLPPQLVGREPLPHEKPPEPPDLPQPGDEHDLSVP